MPSGTIHYALTPEPEDGSQPGSVARGSHFFSWCRMQDTLQALWKIKMTEARITNDHHPEILSLLSRMLLDLYVCIEKGLDDLPSPQDIGALLVILLRRHDLGFTDSDDEIIQATQQIDKLLAEIVLQVLERDIPSAYREWEVTDERLSQWIMNKTDTL
jgi:hypothetical protein